ncbi:MAG TPA: hypothetical protein VGJ22_11645 [Anaerolineales bacterium]|jgi:hypothetical protein
MRNSFSPVNRIRALLILFMLGLVLSGLSAIPVRWEIQVLQSLFGAGTWFGDLFPEISSWMEQIQEGIQNGYGRYPFLAYGTDWLAFGHVAIALAFIGPLRDPVRNIWVVNFGMIACLLVIPWTLVFGSLRGIPLFWMLADMSFGVVGVIPLWLARREILHL